VNTLTAYIPDTSPIEMKMKRLNLQHWLKDDSAYIGYICLNMNRERVVNSK